MGFDLSEISKTCINTKKIKYKCGEVVIKDNFLPNMKWGGHDNSEMLVLNITLKCTHSSTIIIFVTRIAIDTSH